MQSGFDTIICVRNIIIYLYTVFSYMHLYFITCLFRYIESGISDPYYLDTDVWKTYVHVCDV